MSKKFNEYESKISENHYKTFEICRKVELEKDIDFVIITSIEPEERIAVIIRKNGYSETCEEYRQHIIDSLKSSRKRSKEGRINSVLTLTFTHSMMLQIWELCYAESITLDCIISAFTDFEEFDKYSENMNEWFLKVLKYC